MDREALRRGAWGMRGGGPVEGASGVAPGGHDVECNDEPSAPGREGLGGAGHGQESADEAVGLIREAEHAGGLEVERGRLPRRDQGRGGGAVPVQDGHV